MKRILFALLPALTACGSLPDVNIELFSPWRIDVRQGNFVSQDMVVQLKPGQTREQVRFILGSPLVSDVFHADRWDYIYRFAKGNGELQQRQLTVFFESDKLVRVAGDVVAKTGLASAEDSVPKARVITLPGSEPAVAGDGKK